MGSMLLIGYQAQYLKKVRLPSLVNVKDNIELKRLFKEGNKDGIDKLVQRLYKLSDEEMHDIIELVQ